MTVASGRMEAAGVPPARQDAPGVSEALESLESPARVDVGGCFMGALVPGRRNDIDWIGVQVTADVRYLIEVRAWESGLGR